MKEFRIINAFEEKIIYSSISKLDSKLENFVRQNSTNLYINISKDNSSEVNPSIFLVSSDLNVLLHQLSFLDDILAAGLYFGFIKKGQFYLSLEGAGFLFENNLIPEKRLIIVNEDGEKSILYGNDIQKKMVKMNPKDFQKEDILIVLNELNELIAITRAKINSNQILSLKQEDFIAQNMADKGKYLRKKQ